MATQPAGVCLLDTEAKLLKAMEDLLPIAAKAKGFKDNTRWSARTSVTEVFGSFYTKLHTALPFEYKSVVLKDGRYRMKVTNPVCFDVNCPVTPIYFIPLLEPANKELFNLCFYLVILLNKKSGVGLWDEDEDYILENIEENLAYYKLDAGSGHEKEIAHLEEAHQTYSNNGEATLFRTRLRRSGGSKKLWIEAFNEYQPKTELAKNIYEWLKIGKQLIEDGSFFHDYVSMPPEIADDAEDFDERPNTPDECVKLLWRVDDYWHEEFQGMNEAMSSNAGAVPFYITKVIEQPEDVQTIENCFPATLIRFMAAGRKLEKTYRDIFRNPDKLKKALTPKPKPLIDILC